MATFCFFPFVFFQNNGVIVAFAYPEHAELFGIMFLVFRRFFNFFPHMKIATAHAPAQHLSSAGFCCLSWEYTAIVPVFTLDALHRWPNGTGAVQVTLARNPRGSGIKTNNITPNKFIFTHLEEESLTHGAEIQCVLSCEPNWEFVF